ncbi:MAG: hypothetical protein JWR44_579 [Hymenobacter sp.]|jgi:hypothetical protein|nr:hypothetical protein [Hymenobacter sp.]
MSDHSYFPAWREQSLGRRVFLRVTAASAASVALVAAGCSTASTPEPVVADPYLLALPAGAKGLQYYAYVLSLGLAATYQKVVDAPPADLTTAERAIFADMRDHAVVHRELLKYALDPTAGTAPFPSDFAFNTAKFTLTTRAGVLAAAQQLEDLAASAYPVLLPLMTASATQQALLLKIASVNARHAATVRDLLTPGTFAADDAVDANGQLRTKTPTQVLDALAPYFAPYVLTATNLPVPV